MSKEDKQRAAELYTDGLIYENEYLHKIVSKQDKEIQRLNKKLIYVKKTLLLCFDTQETILKALKILQDVNTNGWR